ncbi:MAG: hypothetical protein M1825_000868 [Sarcosagium campestre]|nr:MAG: hypothetical protein M1825_000868 [Sarcosagium campestre]
MSSSPELGNNGRKPQNTQEQITFQFCRECSNMLYPKEDAVNNTLMFACRTCQFSEPATSSCVFRNFLQNTVGETAGVTQDVGSDPTVGLPSMCTMCGTEIICQFCDSIWDVSCVVSHKHKLQKGPAPIRPGAEDDGVDEDVDGEADGYSLSPLPIQSSG